MNIDNFVFPQAEVPFPANNTPQLIERLVASTILHDISLSKGLAASVDSEQVTLKLENDAFIVKFTLKILQLGLPIRTCSIEFQKLCVSSRPIQWVESLLANAIFTVRQFGYQNVAILQPESRLLPLLKRMAFSYEEVGDVYVFSAMQTTILPTE